MRAAGANHDDRDLFLDAAALNMHDFYSSLERILEQIATIVDRSVPSMHDWHRELLRQMTLAVPGVRPAVLSVGTMRTLDEYRRFRHVVRNVYAFELDPVRIDALTVRLRPALAQASAELQAFSAVLEALSGET